MVCLKPTQPHFIIIEFNCQVYSYKMSPRCWCFCILFHGRGEHVFLCLCYQNRPIYGMVDCKKHMGGLCFGKCWDGEWYLNSLTEHEYSQTNVKNCKVYNFALYVGWFVPCRVFFAWRDVRRRTTVQETVFVIPSFCVFFVSCGEAKMQKHSKDEFGVLSCCFRLLAFSPRHVKTHNMLVAGQSGKRSKIRTHAKVNFCRVYTFRPARNKTKNRSRKHEDLNVSCLDLMFNVFAISSRQATRR